MHSPTHLHHAALPLPQACPGTVYMPAVRARLHCMAACDQQVASAPAPTLGPAIHPFWSRLNVECMQNILFGVESIQDAYRANSLS